MPPLAALQRTVELPALSVRAAIASSSIDRNNRTVDVIFTTGAPVRRYDWRTGEYYLERLSMEAPHVRLDRLNSGGPVLDSHNGYGLSSLLGVVVDDSARMAGKKGTATLRFSEDDSAASAWRKVQERVARNVSVGYVVHRYEEKAAKDNKLPERIAIDWEPFEISMVPMPADAGAQTRDGKPADLHPCVIVRGIEDADRDRLLRLARARSF